MTVPGQSSGAFEVVVFQLDGLSFAIPTERVERAFRRVALVPLPDAPDAIGGVFDYHGELVAAVDVRRRLGRPARLPRLGDQLLLVRARARRFALLVDRVEPVRRLEPGSIVAPDTVVPGWERVRGIARLPDAGLVLLHDLDAFLSLEEEEQLAAALAARQP